MNVLVLLSGLLFVLMGIIGGKKGIRSFIALFLNFGVIVMVLFFMSVPYLNPVIITLIACIFIGCINLFYINQVNSTTKTAFYATIVTTFVLVIFISIITNNAMIQGFGEEETEEMGMFSFYIGLDFVKIAVSVIIMSTIGAITDASIAIASPMREMLIHHPKIERKELFHFGLSIGRDILGTSTNTLFFAFFGSYLALLIWFKDLTYSVGEIVNSKVFSSELITICCSAIGVTLVIPVTAWITAYFLTQKRKI